MKLHLNQALIAKQGLTPEEVAKIEELHKSSCRKCGGEMKPSKAIEHILTNQSGNQQPKRLRLGGTSKRRGSK